MASLLVESNTSATGAEGGSLQQQLMEQQVDEPQEQRLEAEGEEDQAAGEHVKSTTAMNGSPGDGVGGGAGDVEDDDDDDDDSSGMVQRLAQMSVASRGGAVGPGGSTAGPPSSASSLMGALAHLGSGEGMAKDRNRMLISHMLSLANPVITENMVQFLLQRGNLEILVSFITQHDTTDAPPAGGPTPSARVGQRPQRGDPMDKETEAALARSFNAVLLLASDEPTEALMTFVGSKATVITESIFEIFHPHARGSFHHGCRVIDHLLRCYTDQILMVVGGSKASVKRYLGPMVRCVEHAPVAETLVKMICLPSLNQLGQYKATPAVKWRMFESLAEWRVLVVLAEQVSDRESSPEHASASAEVLIDLIERLAADDNGELVLQPLGHCHELVNGLMACALDPTADMTQRCECVRVLVNTAVRSAEPQLPGLAGPGAAAFGPGSVTLVPNQLNSVRNDFYKRLGSHLHDICECLLGEGPVPPPPPPKPVAHPGYVVNTPFSFLRLLLVTLLVEIVAYDPKRLGKLPQSVWRLLCGWFFQYPFSNLYHSLFYKLAYQALRSGDEAIQQTLLSKCRLISLMVDAYVKGDKSAGNRGYMLQFCNAVRLQVGTQAPSTWLRTFLKSHDSWRKFTPQLREVTESQQQFGLGISVPNPQKRFGGVIDLSGGVNPLGGGLMEALNAPPTSTQVSIDYGSAFARSLGFEDEVEYVVDESATQTDSQKRKKKKKKKKGGGGGAAAGSKGEDGEQEGKEDEEAAATDEDAEETS